MSYLLHYVNISFRGSPRGYEGGIPQLSGATTRGGPRPSNPSEPTNPRMPSHPARQPQPRDFSSVVKREEPGSQASTRHIRIGAPPCDVRRAQHPTHHPCTRWLGPAPKRGTLAERKLAAMRISDYYPRLVSRLSPPMQPKKAREQARKKRNAHSPPRRRR